MLFLLSSDRSSRYKQDILRCLAAPIGSVVQFRYDKMHIAENTLSEITNSATKFPMEGIVCSVATAGLGPLPIVPVRKVLVQRPREHGETISLTLVVQDVVLADTANVTKDLDRLSGGYTPRRAKEGDEPTGFYFFTAEMPKNVQSGRTIAIWEKTVTTLRDQHAYKNEPFFWVTVGIETDGKTLDSSQLHQWPDGIKPNSQHQLLIYHFRPRGGTFTDSKMEIVFGSGLQAVVPPDTKIDSRYDLKAWRFSAAENPQRKMPTWMRIRTAESWDLDLPLTIKASYATWLLRSLIAGPLVAVPAILAILPQPICAETKRNLIIGAVLAGIGASLASTFRIDRPKTS